MRLVTKLGVLGALTAVAFVGSVGVFMTQLATVSSRYNTILSGTVAQAAQARVMQVTFKKQVQDWKDTLLRGFNATDLKTYHDQFVTDEGSVLRMADTLAGTVDDTAIAAEVRQFQQAVGALNAGYEQAYEAFVASGGTDFKTSDKMVRGKDRPPTDLVDKIVDDLQAHQEAAVASEKKLMRGRERLVLTGAGILLLALTAAIVLIARSITRPLATLRRQMGDIIDTGDLTTRLDDRAKNEIAEVARAGNGFLAWVQQLLRKMDTVSTALDGSVTGLTTVSAQLTDSAQETSAQADSVSSAAGDVTGNVRAVATGAEEMGVSIREIASSASEAARVTGRAVAAAELANTTVGELGAASAEIGSVVATITSIAEQTNLLALNATIEAARAGEAGKGFAVVATEVKDLAQETAKATEDISRRVEAIQQQAEAAVGAIAGIGEVIAQVSAYSTTIASAVEEQTATSGEINRSLSDAAVGVAEISRTIAGVATSATATSSAAATAAGAASDISLVVKDLRETVGHFRV